MTFSGLRCTGQPFVRGRVRLVSNEFSPTLLQIESCCLPFPTVPGKYRKIPWRNGDVASIEPLSKIA